MKHRLMRHTTVAAFLSINIQVEHQGQVRLLTWPVLPLTTWVWLWWQFHTMNDRIEMTIDRWVTSLQQRWSVWMTVTRIGINAILFGLDIAV